MSQKVMSLQIWEVINECDYKKNHNFDYGSSIIVEKIRSELNLINKHDIINNIKNWIKYGYTQIINQKKFL